MKCLLVCVDALDPRLIRRCGLFQSLKGARGKLWSQTARQGKGISSALAWACIYTGSNEAELRHLNLLQMRRKDIKCHTISDTGKLPFWAALSNMGYRVGILEGLVTDARSMPHKEGNVILTGIDGPREWWPEGLDSIVPITRLQNALPWPVGYSTILGKDIPWGEVDEKELAQKMPDYYFGMPEFIKIRNSYLIPSIRSLQEKYTFDFLMVYRYEIDHLCHMQWHETSHKTILRGYRYIEEFVMELRNILQPEHIMVVSDHGMGPLKYDINQPKKINGLDVVQAADNEQVIVSCEHEGPGFFLLTGKKEKHIELNIQDVYGIIMDLFKNR